MLIGSGIESAIRQLDNAYADRIFASYTIADQLFRRSPFRFRELIFSVPPERVIDLVKPMKIAAAIHLVFAIVTVGLVGLILIVG